jgi:hypothetical protein
MNTQNFPSIDTIIDDVVIAAAALREKMRDAEVPGFRAEFGPEEAEMAGAFVEDALSEHAAAENDTELIEIIKPVSDAK